MLRALPVACLAFALVAAAGAAPSATTPPGSIAFVREDPNPADLNAAVDLWVVRSNGRGLRKLVGTPGWDESPAWSPDGRRIAFTKSIYEPGEPEDILKSIDIWTARADGRAQGNLTRDGSASSPAWSPGGATVAFARGNGVFVVRRDGSRKRHVGRRSDPTKPAWSPDGRRIAFVTPGELWIARADGGGQRLVARGAWSDTRAVWSSDGRLLAYAGGRGRASGVFVVPSAGGRPRLLSRHDESAAWSPDGRRLALVRPGTPREAGIFLADPDGRARKRLTRGLDTEPAWSPNGRTIAFRRGLLVGDVYVVNADGSKLRNLTRTPKLDEREPAWRPRS
jgi:Tol biopolymer transport system component